ncbi:protein kinase [Blastocystis sp. ATCC 50177/Nand II]|uniref:mitogen-activated protein kinase kinase n=1 Tax=Blastocystis sp. subtype 1 (strain ATCC 50177 / NandII) TaxID=478820 RepID=A0A196SAH7_BLAHN|nr:protein kinase [Blastocystis sp. ATCC 50177/Nand II]
MSAYYTRQELLLETRIRDVDKVIDLMINSLQSKEYKINEQNTTLTKAIDEMSINLKPSNIFLNDEGDVRFCDYGLEDELLRCGVRMTKNQWVYCAPEVFEGKMDFKSDVWSLGIVLIEAAEGKNPYSDCTARAMFTADPPSLSSSEWPPEFISFVKRYWRR